MNRRLLFMGIGFVLNQAAFLAIIARQQGDVQALAKSQAELLQLLKEAIHNMSPEDLAKFSTTLDAYAILKEEGMT